MSSRSYFSNKRERNPILNHARAHKIVPAIKYLEKTFQNQSTIGDIAKYIGMSQASLHPHFKSASSLSPIQFLKLDRLHNAHTLLLSGHNAGKATFSSGYRSQSQFSREFKKLFGQTPRQVKVGN